MFSFYYFNLVLAHLNRNLSLLKTKNVGGFFLTFFFLKFTHSDSHLNTYILIQLGNIIWNFFFRFYKNHSTKAMDMRRQGFLTPKTLYYVRKI